MTSVLRRIAAVLVAIPVFSLAFVVLYLGFIFGGLYSVCTWVFTGEGRLDALRDYVEDSLESVVELVAWVAGR